MDGTLNPILVDKFSARLGTASALILLDANRRNDGVIVRAVASDVASERQWREGSRTDKPIIVHRWTTERATGAMQRHAGISGSHFTRASPTDTHSASARRDRLSKQMELGEEHHRVVPILE